MANEGTYSFLFVGGTFDATGGQAAGAQLVVDNIVGATTITTYDYALATGSLAEVDQSIGALLGHRAELGATISRITHAVDSLTMTGVNLVANHTALTDTNYAEETSKLASASIINQAATNVLEQTHEASKRVLTSVIRATGSR